MTEQNLDRVFEAGVALGPGCPKAVEAPQNVVMPARGEGEQGHSLVGDPSTPMGAVEVVLTEELPCACFSCLDGRALGSARKAIFPKTLEDVDRGVERAVRRWRPRSAVPTSVVELSPEDPSDESFSRFASDGEPTGQREPEPRNTLVALGFVPLAKRPKPACP